MSDDTLSSRPPCPMHLGTSVMFIILSKCLKASLCHSAHGSGGQIDVFAASAALQPNADYTKERLERLPWARYGSCSAVGIVRRGRDCEDDDVVPGAVLLRWSIPICAVCRGVERRERRGLHDHQWMAGTTQMNSMIARIRRRDEWMWTEY